MAQKSIKTEWYPASINPVRKGWYEVTNMPRLHHMNKFRLTGNRRLWDGKAWKAGWLNEINSIFGTSPTHYWRGFTTEQKG